MSFFFYISFWMKDTLFLHISIAVTCEFIRRLGLLVKDRRNKKQIVDPFHG